MLSVSVELSDAYYLKEYLLKILLSKDKETAKINLKRWINDAKESELDAFKSCITAYTNWFDSIIDSIGQPITNGFTEGCNNKIKVLKRNAYGYQNFDRFRKRILFIFDNAA